VRRLRERQKRNFLATLCLSQGVPMLSGGDEIGRTQLGNNNGYCQDNELSWMNWDLSSESKELLAFTARLLRLQHEEPVFHRRTFFQGRAIRGSNVKDIVWLEASGAELSDRAWQADLRCFGMLLPGDAIDETDDRGKRIIGATLFVMFNAGAEAVHFSLPTTTSGTAWTRVIDTADPHAGPAEFESPAKYALDGRSVAVLRMAVPGETPSALALGQGGPPYGH
jgi:glycogen operon protein